MIFNWLTVVLILIAVGSMIRGAMRGIANETGTVMAELLSIAASMISLWLSWNLGHGLSNWISAVHPKSVPTWMQGALQAWKHSPVAAQLITFFVLYLVISTFLRNTLNFLPMFVAKTIQVPKQSSRWLGGGLGAIMGSLRTVVVGAILFGVLQYVSFPALSNEANQSSVYQYLKHRLYQPYLSSVLTKDFPVFAESAFQPITKNINLFVVPTSTSGDSRGVLIVPKTVAVTAHSITKDDATAREKAYALYEWESHHIHYDWKKYNDFVYHHQWDAQSPMDTLRTRKGVCADYALLYADMAHSVGLDVKIDQGIGGEFGESGPHAWNEFYDSSAKRWVTVDTTWGSEMDTWFDAPGFDKTHALQRSILITGGSS